MLFQGPYAILLSSFLETGEPDMAVYERQIERLCGTELSGIVACGSSGEFSILTPEENIALLKTTAQIAKGRKKLIGGATAGDIKVTLQYLSAMAEYGYDGALIAPPYYFPMGDMEIVDFYRMLNDAQTGVPIVIYQIPQFTSGVSMAVYEKLLALEGVAGLKNSSCNISQIMKQACLRDECKPDFSLLSGSDECIMPCLSIGANGSFTALSGIFPELVTALYRAMGTEDALSIQRKLVKLVCVAEMAPFPLGYKLLAEAAGCFQLGHPRQAVSKDRLNEYRSTIAEAYETYRGCV